MGTIRNSMAIRQMVLLLTSVGLGSWGITTFFKPDYDAEELEQMLLRQQENRSMSPKFNLNHPDVHIDPKKSHAEAVLDMIEKCKTDELDG